METPIRSIGRNITDSLVEVMSSYQVELCMFVIAAFGLGIMHLRLPIPSPWKQGKSPRPPRTPDDSAAIQACGCNAARARALWQDMVSRRAPDAAALVSMVEVLLASGDVDEARELARNVLQGEPLLRPKAAGAVYSSLLKGTLRSKEHHEVMSLYSEMKAQSVPMSTASYNSILASAARNGRMDEVQEMLGAMHAADARAAPDRITYSSIIYGCYQFGDIDSGLAVLNVMRRDTSFRPDEKIYNSLLSGCAQRRWFDQGLRLLEAMEQDGVMLSNYTLSIAIKVLGHARHLDEAFALLQRAPKAHNVRPNIQVYTCLIQACLRAREFDRAFHLYNKIVGEGLAAVDEKTYSVMAWGYLVAGATAEAVKVLRCAYHLPCDGGFLTAKGQPCGLDAECLERVLQELARSNADEALAIEAELEARGMALPFLSRSGAEKRSDQPEASDQISRRGKSAQLCRFFGSSSGCREGDACRFKHVGRDRANL